VVDKKLISVDVTANDQFTDPIRVIEGRRVLLSLVNTDLIGDVSLQIRFSQDPADWRNFITTTVGATDNIELTFTVPMEMEIRLGTTAHTSGGGRVELRVSKFDAQGV